MRIISAIILSILFCAACSEPQHPATKAKTIQSGEKQSNKKSTTKPDSPSQKKQAEDSPTVYKEALKAEIKDVNAKLPVTVETGVTVTNFTVEGNDAVYYYMCEEPKVSMDAVEQAQAKMKEGTTKSLKTTNDPETIHLLRMLRGANMGLIFRYKGTKSGRTVDVVFRPAEILELAE